MRKLIFVLWLAFGAPTAWATEADGYGIQMVRIAPGHFEMGASAGEKSERPAHQVAIGYAFEIGLTEVTQGQWQAVMGDNPSQFSQCGADCPVESVNWADALRFIKRLNQKTGKHYRLPSEAEWEYACRAGGHGEYCGGNEVGPLAWTSVNSGASINQVATRKPNAWGLYDMSGNVWEWVQDTYHPNYQGAPDDGSAWEAGGSQRVLRGGSWYFVQQYARATSRGYIDPTSKLRNIGFRLARTLP